MLKASANHFIVQVARRQAQEILERETIIRLNREQTRRVFDLLDRAPKPNATLLAAKAARRKLVRMNGRAPVNEGERNEGQREQRRKRGQMAAPLCGGRESKSVAVDTRAYAVELSWLALGGWLNLSGERPTSAHDLELLNAHSSVAGHD